MKVKLALADGSIFEGTSIGAEGEIGGEVVFNTSMTGYGEIITDPSYCGQIVTLTYPLIGNYGVCRSHLESRKPFLRGLIVKELCQEPSNWSIDISLTEYLKENNIMAVQGIDTRALTRKLRSHGTMLGLISTLEYSDQELITKAQNVKYKGGNYVEEVTPSQPYIMPGNGYRLVVMDFGAKANILRSLHSFGCHLIVVPATTSAEEILALQPDGVFLSNGPGDPQDVPYAVETVKKLIGKMPIFGICLGHQLIGLALGGMTYKLKFGHRGGNHPVKDLLTGRVYITSQNHGYALSVESLKNTETIITHVNLNDNTVEGIKHKYLPIFSVQYHPEAAPGPVDSMYLFQQFMDMIAQSKQGGLKYA